MAEVKRGMQNTYVGRARGIQPMSLCGGYVLGFGKQGIKVWLVYVCTVHFVGVPGLCKQWLKG